MAATISESEIRQVVSQVLDRIQSAPAATSWDSTQYGGRKLIGIFDDMNEAIRAAEASTVRYVRCRWSSVRSSSPRSAA